MVPHRSRRHTRPLERTAAVLLLCICACSIPSGDQLQITDEDVAQFARQGYLQLRGFASQDMVARMRSSMAEMIDAWDLPANGSDAMATFKASLALRSRQSDGDSPDHSFMLESATKASVFVEPRAVDLEAGMLRPGISKRHAVRKVGHALHLAPGPFRDFSTSPKVAALARALGHNRPAVAQSLYRLVPPLAAGVDRHQDSGVLYTEPPTCLGFWLALEDTNKTNSCVRARGGSHLEPLRERLVRRPGPDGKVQLVFEKLFTEASAPPESHFTPLEVSSGDLVVIHGTLDHVSLAGTAREGTRESFQVHIVDTDARWPSDNWLQYPPGLSFTPLVPPALSTSMEL